MSVWSYLSIVRPTGAKQGFQRVVSGDKESGKVDKKFSGDVEEDKEEVDSHEAEEGIDLRHRCLLFEVVEHGILR